MGQIIEWRWHRHELNLLNDGLAAPGVNLSARKGWKGEDCLAVNHAPDRLSRGRYPGNGTSTEPFFYSADPSCSRQALPDVMGYHDWHEIPNYWTYARQFVLQDHMFEPSIGWSAVSHLYLVSNWSALCTTDNDPTSCTNNITSTQFLQDFIPPVPTNQPRPIYAWTDLTYLLHKNGVSWGYYVADGTQPDCADGAALCTPPLQQAGTLSIWNPLPFFDTVQQDGEAGNIRPLTTFLTAAQNGTLPAVSWVVPNSAQSEHPPASVSNGQAYVTGLVNALMQGPAWSSTAIFLAWDDWGGFYDHKVPPSVDQNGYGFRVPGLVISPYAKQGYIDHQVLSFDAYTKFIEDAFLGGQRLNPASDGRPDPRPDVRETAAQLGDLNQDFDFTQSPRPPLLLPTAARSAGTSTGVLVRVGATDTYTVTPAVAGPAALGSCATRATSTVSLAVSTATGAQLGQSGPPSRCSWVNTTLNAGQTYTVSTTLASGSGPYLAAWSVSDAPITWTVQGAITTTGGSAMPGFMTLTSAPISLTVCSPPGTSFALAVLPADGSPGGSVTSTAACKSLLYTPRAAGLFGLRETAITGTGSFSGTVVAPYVAPPQPPATATLTARTATSAPTTRPPGTPTNTPTTTSVPPTDPPTNTPPSTPTDTPTATPAPTDSPTNTPTATLAPPTNPPTNTPPSTPTDAPSNTTTITPVPPSTTTTD